MRPVDADLMLKILELETKGFNHTETQYMMGYLEAKKQVIDDICDMPTISAVPKWISVKDKLPPAEKRVEICFERESLRDGKPHRHITIGIYEDGTIDEADSRCVDNSEDCFRTNYDEEEDRYLLAEGWFELLEGWGAEYCNELSAAEVVTHWRELSYPPEEESK